MRVRRVRRAKRRATRRARRAALKRARRARRVSRRRSCRRACKGKRRCVKKCIRRARKSAKRARKQRRIRRAKRRAVRRVRRATRKAARKARRVAKRRATRKTGPNVTCKSLRVCAASKWICKRRKRGACVKRRIRCLKPKTVRKCYVVATHRKPVWKGPRKCKAGKLVVKKTGRVITASCAAAPAVQKPDAVCWATGDPHYKTVTGKAFDFYGVGDYLLARTADKIVEVHTRQRRMKAWPTASVNTAIAVKYNGGDVFTYHAKKQVFRVNGQKVKLAVGKVRSLPRGGAVKRSAENSWELHAANGVRVVAHYFKANADSYYVNAYVYAPAELQNQFSGLCATNAQQTRVGGLFRSVKLPKHVEVPMPKVTRKIRKEAAKFCKGHGLKGGLLKNCKFDFVIGGPAVAIAETKVKADVKKATVTKRKQKWWKRAAKAVRRL